jgi:hypothetical protein
MTTITIKTELTFTVQIGRGPCIRQTCPLCHGETYKHAVQAFARRAGAGLPFGALCEDCLEERTESPTLPELLTARRAWDAEQDRPAGWQPRSPWRDDLMLDELVMPSAPMERVQ